MAFTKALYYPWIEIHDELWLKNSMLYWDKIHTIVPKSIRRPYKNETAKIFFNEGILIPYFVHPDLEDIDDLTVDFLEYIKSPEGRQVLYANEIIDNDVYKNDQLANKKIQRIISMYTEKFAWPIQELLRNFLKFEDDLFYMNSSFANYYMTCLATNISEKRGIALLTDSLSNNRLASAIRLDCNLSTPFMKYELSDGHIRQSSWDRELRHNRKLAQAMLADLILEGVRIDPETSAKQIIIFRDKFKNELGLFRTKVAELANEISIEQPLQALRQSIKDKFINEVGPAIELIKIGLKENMIRYIADTFLKVSFFSTTATSVPLALVGLSIPYALLAGVGVSITANTVLYNTDKAQKLRENPFTYLLKVQKEFDPNRYQVTVTAL